jgi:hypothetical protein
MLDFGKQLFFYVGLTVTVSVMFGTCQAVGQSSSLSPSIDECKKEMKGNETSLEGSLLRYTSALSSGDISTAAKYLARFTLDTNRKRIYRTRHEQDELLKYMASHPIRAFRFCVEFSSTRELSYSESQREHFIIGYITYGELDKESNSRVFLVGYHDRGQWVFSPVLPPRDIFPVKVPTTIPPIPMESPPPMISPSKLPNRTRD